MPVVAPTKLSTILPVQPGIPRWHFRLMCGWLRL